MASRVPKARAYAAGGESMKRSRREIVLKSPREIATMRVANQHVAEILEIMCAAVSPGVSTWDLDLMARAELKKRGLRSPFLGYHGYPAVVCTSVNEEIVHGIPRRVLILLFLTGMENRYAFMPASGGHGVGASAQ